MSVAPSLVPTVPSATSGDPVLAALDRIEQRLADVERVTAGLSPAATALGALPGGVAMLTDTIDALAAHLADHGIDVDARLRSVLRAVEVSTTPRAVNGLAALVESRLLDPSALAVVSRLAAALADPGDTAPVGVWAALRALREPDVQRALGFVLAVARAFGRHLDRGELDACRERLLTAADNPSALELP
jgi:uncharacterized protein YjgD (DUF1641 family)